MTNFDFDKPLLVTERLELWLPRAEDLHTTYDVVREPETARFLGAIAELNDHFMRFARGAGSWFLYGYGSLIVRLRGQSEVIGSCGLFHSIRGMGEDFDDNPEAGWILAADHVGKGLGLEAMEAILAWFDRVHGPRRVVCMIEQGNDPSVALARRMGFTHLRDSATPDGTPVSLLERVP